MTFKEDKNKRRRNNSLTPITLEEWKEYYRLLFTEDSEEFIATEGNWDAHYENDKVE